MSATLTKTNYLFRRELWENRGGVIWTPVSIAAVSILLILLSLALGLDDFGRQVGDAMEWANRSDANGDQKTLVIDFSGGRIVVAEDQDLDQTLWGSRLLEIFDPSMHSIAVAFELVAYVVTFFYLLGGLFNDRKDRTILFWKSLPFSETQGVLVKLAVAALLIPLLALLAALAVQLVFGTAMMTVIARNSELGFGEIFSQVNMLSVFFGHLLLILVLAIKNLPLFSWLMFASAFSRRSPFLTAIIPPVAIIALEAMIFGSSHFADFISSFSFQGSFEFAPDILSSGNLAQLLVITPLQLAKIAVVSIPLIAGAIWLRNNRYEI